MVTTAIPVTRLPTTSRPTAPVARLLVVLPMEAPVEMVSMEETVALADPV